MFRLFSRKVPHGGASTVDLASVFFVSECSCEGGGGGAAGADESV